MDVYFKPRGWDVYGYYEGTYKDKSFIDFVTVITPHPTDDSTCIVGFAKGELKHEMNTAIGQRCYKLGFTKMVFSRPIGKSATRYSTFTHSSDGLDWYEVDLTLFAGTRDV